MLFIMTILQSSSLSLFTDAGSLKVELRNLLSDLRQAEFLGFL